MSEDLLARALLLERLDELRRRRLIREAERAIFQSERGEEAATGKPPARPDSRETRRPARRAA